MYIKIANKFYQKKKKEKLRKEACEGIKIFLQKKKKYQYHRDPNKNLSEEEKKKKVQYMRKYYLAHKFYKVVWKLKIPTTNFRISKKYFKL